MLAPLVYAAALFLLLEEWLWDVGNALLARLAALPPLRALEGFLARLGPVGAMAAFLLPALMLFPIKLLALFAMAHGHALLGLCVFILAKVAGAAAVARLYALTRPALLSLRWFAYLHGRFMELKERWIGRLKATRAWRRCQAGVARVKDALRAWRAGWKRGRHSARPMRALRRFTAFWRARRR